MAKKSKNEEPAPAAGGGGWITTYADMITLLMCFFVIMYSASEPSQSKWEQLKGGIESDQKRQTVDISIRGKMRWEKPPLAILKAHETLTCIKRLNGP